MFTLSGYITAAGPGAWIGYRDITGTSVYRPVQNGVNSTPTFFGGTQVATQCAAFGPLAAVAVAPGISWTSAVCTTLLPFICELEPPCSAVVPAINL
jgi:hypothetical protein